jgi:hypothetical protein
LPLRRIRSTPASSFSQPNAAADGAIASSVRRIMSRSGTGPADACSVTSASRPYRAARHLLSAATTEAVVAHVECGGEL